MWKLLWRGYMRWFNVEGMQSFISTWQGLSRVARRDVHSTKSKNNAWEPPRVYIREKVYCKTCLFVWVTEKYFDTEIQRNAHTWILYFNWHKIWSIHTPTNTTCSWDATTSYEICPTGKFFHQETKKSIMS